eukprot:TRINITY_DN28149_c0_g1_i2.p1 TRINITY_DN28149_c0_g1~~TRINITY_DN28149_c0_g1_i2.p1  ORF type:complete len:318 (+),score=60.19 TRINITY_DN28149_c0_g1_i2:92-955(+)
MSDVTRSPEGDPLALPRGDPPAGVPESAPRQESAAAAGPAGRDPPLEPLLSVEEQRAGAENAADEEDWASPVFSPRTREQRRRDLRKVAIAVALLLVVAATVYFLGKRFLSGMADAAGWLRDQKAGGIALMSVTMFLAVNATAVVPMLYGPLVLLSGYTWGIAALAFTYPSALLGAVLGFAAARGLFRERVERALEAAPRLRRVRLALGAGGLGMSCLLRYFPAPFGMVTLTMAVSPVRGVHYAAATALALLRQVPQLLIGHSADDLGDLLAGKGVPAKKGVPGRRF